MRNLWDLGDGSEVAVITLWRSSWLEVVADPEEPGGFHPVLSPLCFTTFSSSPHLWLHWPRAAPGPLPDAWLQTHGGDSSHRLPCQPPHSPTTGAVCAWLFLLTNWWPLWSSRFSSKTSHYTLVNLLSYNSQWVCFTDWYVGLVT